MRHTAPKDSVIALLSKQQYAPVVITLPGQSFVWMNFTEHNPDLPALDLVDTEKFNDYVFNTLLKGNIGIGGYGENRIIYRRSAHYGGQEPRSVHLGIDLWAKANTAVYAPLYGTIHSYQDNQGFGNYGPTLLLEHRLENFTFYSLYGHLSRKSLEHINKGQVLRAGDKLGEIGDFPENGDWPPHLHFQVILDLQGYEGDYPGVATPSQASLYLKNCPDPNLILQLPA